WRGHGVEPRHIGSILRPLGRIATDVADPLHLVVVPCVSLAGERRGRTRGKLRDPLLAAGNARNTERRHVLPLKSDSTGGRATWRELPHAGVDRRGRVELRR